MSRPWQLQHAKNQLSEVIDRSLREGPQVVTRHGEPVVVVVSWETWQRQTGAVRPFKEFLRQAPLAELDLRRDQDPGRELDLS